MGLKKFIISTVDRLADVGERISPWIFTVGKGLLYVISALLLTVLITRLFGSTPPIADQPIDFLPISTPTPIPTLIFTPTPPLPTDTPTPIPLPTDTPSPPPSPTLYDDFNGASLDESKWIFPTNENLIYQADGVLNLINTQPAEETVAANVRATRANRPIRQISFIINLKSYEGTISGGAGLAVCLADGKRLRVDVGPEPKNGTGVEFSIHRNPPCVPRDYSEEEHPVVNEYFQPYVPTPIGVVWTGKEVQFYINNNLKVTEPANSSSITEFLFYMYADPGSVYHVTVDDVHVLYAD
jgi:hypothetical protein